jgi:Uma2 family endonuclease
MTFEEFQQVPDPQGGRYELHHGELVKVAYPEYHHVRAQWQLRRLLENAAGEAGIVKEEMPFRPTPEYDGWCADVAFVSTARWESIDRYLSGAPELVIEVVSPSNTAAELLEKEQICLENGAREFWAADTRRHTVRVSTASGHVTYKSGQSIPLFFGGCLAVDDIFR